MQLEARRCRALEQGDIAALETLLSPRLVYVHSTGTVHDRHGLLELLRSQVRFHSVQRAGLVEEERGDVTWATGFLRLAGKRLATGDDFTSVSFVTQVWCCEAGTGWRLAAFQSTRVDEALWCGPSDQSSVQPP
jgi:hypothetical protein